MSDISLSLAVAARRVSGIDRVWLAVAAVLLVGALLAPDQTASSIGWFSPPRCLVPCRRSARAA